MNGHSAVELSIDGLVNILVPFAVVSGAVPLSHKNQLNLAVRQTASLEV